MQDKLVYPTDFINKIICGDCLEVMKGIPDKAVDLVLTDPPYGIGADKAQYDAAQSRIKANWQSKAGRGYKLYDKTEWDNARPKQELFTEMARVSQNQVIWGGGIILQICYHHPWDG